MQRYRHKKTGNIYFVLTTAITANIDCINVQDGARVVIFCRHFNEGLLVCEESIFNEMFEPLQPSLTQTQTPTNTR
jgi:hypothetical protein